MTSRPPIFTLFPYTTLFRSAEDFARANHLREQACDDLMIHRRPHRENPDLAVGKPVAIFRRYGRPADETAGHRSEEHTSELQSRLHLVCRLLLEKKKSKYHT